MSKEIIVNRTFEETRVAVLENSKLSDIFIERRESEKKEILIKLSPNINFFYENSGTGKTTLLNLINYALGQDMKLSAIVQKEIKRVVLDIYINGKTVILGRD